MTNTREIINRKSANVSVRERDARNLLAHQQKLPLCNVFRLFSPLEKFDAIVADALACGGAGPLKGPKQSLDGAINGCQDIQLDGFKKASLAKPRVEKLKVLVLDQCLRDNQQMLGSVLKIWKVSQESLRHQAEESLSQAGWESNPANFRKNGYFHGLCTVKDWRSLLDQINTDNLLPTKEGKANDIAPALMLSLISGALPAQPGELAEVGITENFLKNTLTDFRAKDSSDLIWDEFEEFMRGLDEIRDEKVVERETEDKIFAQDYIQQIEQMAEHFAEELEYLEIDLGSLLKKVESDITALVSLTEDYNFSMHSLLTKFELVLPLGATISEEHQRTPMRQELQEKIQALFQQWNKEIDQELSSRQFEPVETCEPKDESGASLPEKVNTESEELQALRKRLKKEQVRSEQYKSRIVTKNKELSSLFKKNKNLEKSRDKAINEKNVLQEQLDSLGSGNKYDISDEGRYADSDLVQFKNVRDAVDQAGQMYPNQLLYEFNSKSDDNTPYSKPVEVFKALCWLATEYRNCKLHSEKGVDLGKLLQKTCPNWSYSPHQSATTKGKWKEWYIASRGEKKYELDSHIKAGNKHDPKSTIRIAFAWDEEDKVVVVGFIGLHQKNTKS